MKCANFIKYFIIFMKFNENVYEIFHNFHEMFEKFHEIFENFHEMFENFYEIFEKIPIFCHVEPQTNL
jgi:hypothetical protein